MSSIAEYLAGGKQRFCSTSLHACISLASATGCTQKTIMRCLNVPMLPCRPLMECQALAACTDENLPDLLEVLQRISGEAERPVHLLELVVEGPSYAKNVKGPQLRLVHDLQHLESDSSPGANASQQSGGCCAASTLCAAACLSLKHLLSCPVRPKSFRHESSCRMRLQSTIVTHHYGLLDRLGPSIRRAHCCHFWCRCQRAIRGMGRGA